MRLRGYWEIKDDVFVENIEDIDLIELDDTANSGGNDVEE